MAELRFAEKNGTNSGESLLQCQFAHHESDMKTPESESKTPQLEAGIYPPELRMTRACFYDMKWKMRFRKQFSHFKVECRAAVITFRFPKKVV
jgi:hypothetical protein